MAAATAPPRPPTGTCSPPWACPGKTRRAWIGKSPGGVWVPGGPCWSRCSSLNPRRLWPGRRCGSGPPGLEPPAAVDVSGEMVSETGERYRWETRLQPGRASQEPGGAGRVPGRNASASARQPGVGLLRSDPEGAKRRPGGNRPDPVDCGAVPGVCAGLAGGGPPGLGFQSAALCLAEPGQLGRGGFCRPDGGHPLGRPPGGGVCGGQSPPCGRGAGHSRPQSLFPHQPDFPQCFVPEPGSGAGDGRLPEGPGPHGQPGISGRQSPPGRGRPGAVRGSPPFKAPGPEAPVPDVLRGARRPGGSPRSARGQEFARFVAAGGESLARFGRFSALADHLKRRRLAPLARTLSAPRESCRGRVRPGARQGSPVFPVWAMAGRHPTGPGVPGGP